MKELLKVAPHVYVAPERYLHCNVYVITAGDKYFLVDPGMQPAEWYEQYKEAHTAKFSANYELCLGNQIYELAGALVTHAHFDHIRGVGAFLNLKVWAAKAELPLFSDPHANASGLFGAREKFSAPGALLHDGDKIKISDDLEVTMLLTPGHTCGSCCYTLWQIYAPDKREALCIFSGDTVFDDSYGRCDLATGSVQDMRSSLDRLLSYFAEMPPVLSVLPGHGAPVSVGKLTDVIKSFDIMK